MRSSINSSALNLSLIPHIFIFGFRRFGTCTVYWSPNISTAFLNFSIDSLSLHSMTTATLAACLIPLIWLSTWLILPLMNSLVFSFFWVWSLLAIWAIGALDLFWSAHVIEAFAVVCFPSVGYLLMQVFWNCMSLK